jgi:hypothetical protein
MIYARPRRSLPDGRPAETPALGRPPAAADFATTGRAQALVDAGKAAEAIALLRPLLAKNPIPLAATRC